MYKLTIKKQEFSTDQTREPRDHYRYAKECSQHAHCDIVKSGGIGKLSCKIILAHYSS